MLGGFVQRMLHIILEAEAIPEVCPFSSVNPLQSGVDFFEGFFGDIYLLRILRSGRLFSTRAFLASVSPSRAAIQSCSLLIWLVILPLHRLSKANQRLIYLIKTPDEPYDDRFVEACQMHCHIEYMADVLTVGDLEERVALVDELMKSGKISFLKEYTARKKEEVAHRGEESENT